MMGSLWEQSFWTPDNKDIFVTGRHEGEWIRCPLSHCHLVSDVPVSDEARHAPELTSHEAVYPKPFDLNEN